MGLARGFLGQGRADVEHAVESPPGAEPRYRKELLPRRSVQLLRSRLRVANAHEARGLLLPVVYPQNASVTADRRLKSERGAQHHENGGREDRFHAAENCTIAKRILIGCNLQERPIQMASSDTANPGSFVRGEPPFPVIRWLLPQGRLYTVCPELSLQGSMWFRGCATARRSESTICPCWFRSVQMGGSRHDRTSDQQVAGSSPAGRATLPSTGATASRWPTAGSPRNRGTRLPAEGSSSS